MRVHHLELAGPDLDAGAIAEVAHPEISGDPEAAEVRLGVLHLAEPLRRHGEAVAGPARETGRGRRVPGREAELPRRRADIALGPAEPGQRRAGPAAPRRRRA